MKVVVEVYRAGLATYLRTNTFPLCKHHLRYDLGEDCSGHKVDDIQLPPWAGSWDEFCQIHRAALESE